MGIFRPDTEEEKLLKALKNRNTNSYFQEEVIHYVEGIIKGNKKNDFFETDFLVRAILEMVEVGEQEDISFLDYLEEVKDQLALLFPNGDKTENYEMLKERFLNQYCGRNG